MSAGGEPVQSGRVLLTNKELSSSGQPVPAGPVHVAASYVGTVNTVELYSFRVAAGAGKPLKFWCDQANFIALFQALVALSSLTPVTPKPVPIDTLDADAKKYGSMRFDGAMVEYLGPAAGMYCSYSFTPTAPQPGPPVSFHLTQGDGSTLIYLTDTVLSSNPLPKY